MRRLTIGLTVMLLAVGTIPITVEAQTQWLGAKSLHAQLKNATPIIKEAACNGRTGHCGCGAGFISACGNRCCHCVPC
jgi:hypothetical protein